MHLPNPMPAFARNAMATRFEIVLPGHHATRFARQDLQPSVGLNYPS